MKEAHTKPSPSSPSSAKATTQNWKKKLKLGFDGLLFGGGADRTQTYHLISNDVAKQTFSKNAQEGNDC
ncbi:unnamed protein product [Orchesella dallaii]|uniref:Uncharacterized protein n=1 Tax=Orchesella dallaii TaxID=48710 RepID=A0ABP1QMV7_9HEXA